jgi:hypothetical protein
MKSLKSNCRILHEGNLKWMNEKPSYFYFCYLLGGPTGCIRVEHKLYILTIIIYIHKIKDTPLFRARVNTADTVGQIFAKT